MRFSYKTGPVVQWTSGSVVQWSSGPTDWLSALWCFDGTLNNLYILMRQSDLDLTKIKVYQKFGIDIKRYNPLSAGLSVPDLVLEETAVHWWF